MQLLLTSGKPSIAYAFYTYLGSEVGNKGPDSGKEALIKLKGKLVQLGKAPLKPEQKLWALKNVVVAQQLHSLMLGSQPSGVL